MPRQQVQHQDSSHSTLAEVIPSNGVEDGDDAMEEDVEQEGYGAHVHFECRPQSRCSPFFDYVKCNIVSFVNTDILFDLDNVVLLVARPRIFL